MVPALEPTGENIMGKLKSVGMATSLRGSYLFPLLGSSQLDILQPSISCNKIK